MPELTRIYTEEDLEKEFEDLVKRRSEASRASLQRLRASKQDSINNVEQPVKELTVADLADREIDEAAERERWWEWSSMALRQDSVVRPLSDIEIFYGEGLLQEDPIYQELTNRSSDENLPEIDRSRAETARRHLIWKTVRPLPQDTITV